MPVPPLKSLAFSSPAELGGVWSSMCPAHNLGESVQLALESLPGVERAYVHVDVKSNPSS